METVIYKTREERQTLVTHYEEQGLMMLRDQIVPSEVIGPNGQPVRTNTMVFGNQEEREQMYPEGVIIPAMTRVRELDKKLRGGTDLNLKELNEYLRLKRS
jgi:hypothetical protein